jgi:hypothetical protein
MAHLKEKLARNELYAYTTDKIKTAYYALNMSTMVASYIKARTGYLLSVNNILWYMYIKILDSYRYKVGKRNLLSCQQRKMYIDNYGVVPSHIFSKRYLYLDRRDTS